MKEFNVEKIRKDFPMLKQKMRGHDLIYFDNAATTLKPQVVIDKVVEYYETMSTNIHRADYDIATKTNLEYDGVRKKVAKFINCDEDEVVFTNGTTMALNQIAYGLINELINEDDEILVSAAEHAANLITWMNIAKNKKAKLISIPLNEKGCIDVVDVKFLINDKTKLIAISHITNGLGTVNDVEDICNLAQENNIISIIDGAQSVAHMPIDVKEIGCDFFVFSGHKLCSPTGIGIIYGKKEMLNKVKPVIFGGGMNHDFDSCDLLELKTGPMLLEAGTPPIEATLGLGAAIDYLMDIGMENIHNYELELKAYLVEKMNDLDNVELYYPIGKSGILTFNFKNVFFQDGAYHLNNYGIAVRSGEHCAKALTKYMKIAGNIRVSLYFYNTKEEIDKFIEACKKVDNFLDAFIG